jgi:hypothetical protein
MGRYAPLHAFLAAKPVLPLTLSFDQVGLILGFTLPPLARMRSQWWANRKAAGTNHTQSLAWIEAGLKAKPDLGRQIVTFSS